MKILLSAFLAGLLTLGFWYGNQDTNTFGASQKISELTALSDIASNDLIPIVDTSAGVTKSVTFANLLTSATSTNFLTQNLLAFGSTTLEKLMVRTSATATDFYTTNFLGLGSTTLQQLVSGSTTARTNFLTDHATTTNLYVGNRASTTDLRANTSNFGTSVINNLTVTTCTGCSTGTITLYGATTTASRYLAKTLSLVSGDLVRFGCFASAGTNKGTLGYKISAPWDVASTTISNATSVADDPGPVGDFFFLATTTSTVTFDCATGDAGQTKSMWVMLQNTTYNQSF